MYVHDIISTKQGMMMHLNKTIIGMAYNHIYYLNYTGSDKEHNHTKRNQINNTSTNAHILWHSRITIFHSIVINFPFITPVLAPIPVTSLVRDPLLSPLPIVYFDFNL